MLTIREAAQRLGIRESTVRAWTSQRRLGFVRVGRRAIRIPLSEIEKVIQRGFVPAREPSRGG